MACGSGVSSEAEGNEVNGMHPGSRFLGTGGITDCNLYFDSPAPSHEQKNPLLSTNITNVIDELYLYMNLWPFQIHDSTSNHFMFETFIHLVRLGGFPNVTISMHLVLYDFSSSVHEIP